MELKDKDLLSVQEVRQLVERSKNAQKILAKKSQEQINKIIENIARAGEEHAQELAQMAVEETGFGIKEDKVIKNVFASKGVYERIRNLKTVGVLSEDPDTRIMEIGVPVGIVAGIIPSTNPTSTVLYKTLISIKAGNSIVISPHPGAKNSILRTVEIIREALRQMGEPEDLVTGISIPTMQSTQELMRHPHIAVILATGGAAMVKSAYSSGNPALGVGPGNGPAYIELSCNIAQAVERIFASKTFDNGTICASEQSVITERSIASQVEEELKRQGGYFLTEEQAKRLGKFILRENGTMNPKIVGKSVQAIAQLANIQVPESARVLIARETKIGKSYPYSREKLAPILAFYVGEDYQQICDTCQEILLQEGAGHTFIMHSNDREKIEYFARRIPVSRFLVNTPGSLGGVGATTGLMPAYTLGCGAVGGSATSDNVGPMNLINIRRVAAGVREMSQIRHAMTGSHCQGQMEKPMQNQDLNMDILIQKVMERLQAM